jgi:hypothetical protein
MSSDDQHYTYNPLSNDDKELLLRNGYRPGELPADEEQELLRDLRDQTDGDEDSDRLSSEMPADEYDGND